MKLVLLYLVWIISLTLFFLPQLTFPETQSAGATQAGQTTDGGTVRYEFVMKNGLPGDYEESHNPFSPTSGNLQEGKQLYQVYCTVCHGESGKGDGPSGKALIPPPADLRITLKLPYSTDGFLFWSIAEGGTELKTTMLPFKWSIPKDKIWKLILYIRSL